MKDRITMHLTSSEAKLINDLRQETNRRNSEHNRIQKRQLISRCKFTVHNGSQCPAKAHPDKEGYCGQHYNKVHQLMQWAVQ